MELNLSKKIDIKIIEKSGGDQSPVSISLRHNKLTNKLEKFLQKLLYILLTKKGSMTLLPEFGTTFLIEKEKNWWKTQADVLSSFAVAKVDLIDQLNRCEPEIMSQVKSIEITKIKIFYDKVEVTIKVDLENRKKLIGFSV